MGIDLILKNIPQLGFYDEIEIERSFIVDDFKAEFWRCCYFFGKESLLYFERIVEDIYYLFGNIDSFIIVSID